MSGMRLPALLAGCFLASCSLQLSDRSCATDENCWRDGVMGACLSSPASASSWCAFPVGASECASGLEWGPLSGDHLEGACVESILDGGVDAPTISDAGAADAGIDADLPDPRVLLPAKETDEVYVYDAPSLAPLPTVMLPDRPSTGSYGIGLTEGIVYVPSDSRVTALDGATLGVLPGYPLEVTLCQPGGTLLPYHPYALFSGGAMFCANHTMGKVYRLDGSPLALVDSADLPMPRFAGGNMHRLLVPHGTDGRTVQVLDGTTLDPIGPSDNFANLAHAFAVDEENHRIAFGLGNWLRLENSDALTETATIMYPVDTVIVGLAFDSASRRLVVSFGRGEVACYDSLDLSELVPPTQRGRVDHGVFQPWIDGDRVYAIDAQWAFGSEWRLLVLDLATLEHVPGSPVVLPGEPAGLAVVR